MIRPYRQEDFQTVTRFWYDAMRVAMPEVEARMAHSLDDARSYFRNVVAVENQLWVYELENQPVGYLGIQSEFIDRIYVDPARHRRGIGQSPCDHAKTLSPKHLWLFTHAANTMARSFYEKNGFVAERFGISPVPESEPDVEYHWRKA